jgi:ABC-type glycerol-3-phosphate transport system substrate-binding protein
MKRYGLSRRKALQIGTAAAALPLVHIRSAGAAGKLAAGFWDHWVPTGNDVMKKQVAAWADKNKVDVTLDFLGDALLTTAAAEQQAKTGHDIFALPTWEVHNHRDAMEPVDDVVKHLSDEYGPINPVAEYLAKIDGHWLAIPGSSGSQTKPPCARISIMKEAAGIDVVAMYPAKDDQNALQDGWTWDAHLKAAEACKKAGKAFGIGLGQTSDSVDFAGSLFAAYGAELVDAKGNITIDSDAVKTVLEYAQKLVPLLPPDTVSYDDASNNRALISGASALIFNPPSAWAVAVRDNRPVGEDCWTFPAPAGPKGRFTPSLPYFWGIWNFSKNVSAAKDLCTYLM